MAKGIYMGGEKLKGIASKQIRDLVAEIIKQRGKFSKQAGKAKLWDKFGDIVQMGASLFGPGGVAIGSIADFLIDQISGTQLMSGTKAGDPEAIERLQTAYTGGGYGEEFGKMIKETKPDFWSGLSQEAIEGLKSYVAGEAMGYGAEGSSFDDWIKSLFSGGGSGVNPSKFVPGREFNPMIDTAEPFSFDSFKYGGKVPSPKKYYGGGSVSDSPTISEYFDMQGKTLGGSNKQSLAEKLGRI